MKNEDFVTALSKNIAAFEKELPLEETKLAKMQQEVEEFADTVRSKLRILDDAKKLRDKYSVQKPAPVEQPWQQGVLDYLATVNEAPLKEVYNAVRKYKGARYDPVMHFVLDLMKNNRVVRVRRGVYRLAGKPYTAPSPAKALALAATKKPAKKKKSKKKPRRKKVAWIQAAQRIMNKQPAKVWTNLGLCVEVESITKEVVTNRRMANFLRRATLSGLIQRVGRGEYTWVI